MSIRVGTQAEESRNLIICLGNIAFESVTSFNSIGLSLRVVEAGQQSSPALSLRQPPPLCCCEPSSGHSGEWGSVGRTPGQQDSSIQGRTGFCPCQGCARLGFLQAHRVERLALRVSVFCGSSGALLVRPCCQFPICTWQLTKAARGRSTVTPLILLPRPADSCLLAE